jgi:hypothetical protein
MKQRSQKRPWWNWQLWPEPTLAQLERRKSFCAKLVAGGLCASLLLLSVGWLFESKPKPQNDFVNVPGLERYETKSYSAFGWIWRIATDGPFGICGAIMLSGTIALGIGTSSLNSQLDKARKKESSP